MNPIAINLGFATITWYALFIVTGMLVCLMIANFEIKRHEDINRDIFFDYVFYLLIFSIVGARTWYVLFNLNMYLDNPVSMIAIWNGGLAIHGGLIGGLLTTIYFGKKYRFNFLTYTDVIVPGLLFGQMLGRWGNFMNQEAHGPATTKEFLSNTLHLPEFIVNGMYINGTYYQPTFLYESVWNLVGFVIIITVLRPRWRYKVGYLTSFYLMWYGFFRFYLENLRTDALTLGNTNLEVAKIASLIMFCCGLYYFVKEAYANRN